MIRLAKLRAAACIGLLALGAGCDASEVPVTQVVVTVDGDPRVLEQLQRIRAQVYALDRADGGAPLETHEFTLSTRADAGPGEVDTPFSFGIVRGDDARFALVVEGFGAAPASAGDAGTSAPALIEAKRVIAFVPSRTVAARVYLATSCFGMINPCTSLAQTCHPQARACGPVLDAVTEVAEPGVTPAPDGGVADALARDPACPPVNGCSADYPCASTQPSGYVCLGERAEWPVVRGPARAESFDVASDPALATDRVTGLTWQRARPERYDGCTGTQFANGDLCSWDEAKIYCSRLQLGGRRWRLPSKAELESLLVLGAGMPTLAREVFPSPFLGMYWTSSAHPFGRLPDAERFPAWVVNFMSGMTGLIATEMPLAVRCVSGTPAAPPDPRFEVDEAADVVTDRRTMLTWARTEAPDVATLADAQRACSARGEGFRVPDVQELLSIHVPTRSRALVPAFPKPRTWFAWATAARPDGSLERWYVEAAMGSSYAMDNPEIEALSRSALDGLPHVRCVR